MFSVFVEIVLLWAHRDLLAVLVVSFCGWATHSLWTVDSMGVLWVSTGTRPCGAPSRQDDGDIRAPARAGVVKCCRGRE